MTYTIQHNPQKKMRITQDFGVRPKFYLRFGLKGHEGIDINEIPGTRTNLYACESGTVRIKQGGAYGNRIEIYSGNFQYTYAHVSDMYVKNGDAVKAGDLIGRTGNTSSYGMPIHLHFMVRQIKDGNILNRNNGYGGSLPISYNGEKLVVDFSPYDNISEYKGLKVMHELQPKSAPKRSGWYNPYKKEIIIYPYFYTHSIAKQGAILEHEYVHHCQFYKIPEKYLSLWKLIYDYDENLINTFNSRSNMKFDGKKFINSHAAKHWREDMAEQIEYKFLIHSGEAEILKESTLLIKYNIGNFIFEKFQNVPDNQVDIDYIINKYG